MKIQEALRRQGLVAARKPVDSDRRFPDGAEYRIEIPSVEGPRVLAAVVEQADRYDLTVNRVSQGSGGMLLEEGEIREMAAIGAETGLEVCLFTGPKAGYDVGAFSRSEDGRSQFAQIRGMRQLRYAAADIFRATEAGIRSFLVGDLGLLAVLTRMQRDGDLPSETVWKISAYMGVSNPASIRMLEEIGAGSVNIPADVTLEQLWEIRSAASIPIDLYLETPDSMGPVVRGHEIADFVAVGAPLHAKMGLANAGGVYPSGGHTVGTAIANAREKVRRAAIALEWLQRERPASVQSKPHAAGLGIPVVS
ncbi:MAG: U32 family peptidase [bacterium]|nr:U32 family peptidase [bacterium]MDE0352410.1 U32 family peptidase [bacterium]